MRAHVHIGHPESRTVSHRGAPCARLASPYERKVSRDANAKAAENLKGKGMLINVVAPAEIERMRNKVKAVSDKYVKEGGQALAEEINTEIAKVRASR